MKPYKISQLSSAFIIAVTSMAVILGLYMLYELDGITNAIHKRERQAAVDEIKEALISLENKVRDAARRISDWDETKQQLVFDEYYAIWRDSRIKDAGIVPPSIDTVALYNKAGEILRPGNEWDPMPKRIGSQAKSAFLLKPANVELHSHSHIYYFTPVYADPSQEIRMGSVGLKFDLLAELVSSRKYRFADITSFRFSEGQLDLDGLSQLTDFIDFEIRPNPSLDFIRDVFETELLRLLLFVIGILSLASYLLHRVMVRPLRSISSEIDTLQGASDRLASKISTLDTLPVAELEHVRRSFSNYQNRLAELHSNLEDNAHAFHEQARKDALTGTYNRRAFDEDWQPCALQTENSTSALLLFDCDHFKAINDSYGHDVGDSVIQGIAAGLEKALRSGDRLYRLGGDEFATVLSNVDEWQAKQIAERCLENIQAHDFSHAGLPEPVGISIGVSMGDNSHNPLSLSELQKQADLAMYAAKRPDSEKIVFYRPELGEVAPLVASKSLNAVFNAIRDPSLLAMRYQGIMKLPKQGQKYVEALARIHVDGEYFSPGDIFPIVQARRLDAEFDLAIIQAVQLDFESEKLTKRQGVSINISAPGIVHARVVSALLKLKQREKRRKIVIEITETALITHMETATKHIQLLRDAGFLIALDDFGSGYSSLRYLSVMPVDIVKFDISMIHLLEQQQSKQCIITKEVSKLVKKAGYLTVAEGIETESLLNKVIEIGFDYAQGFYFGKP